MTAHESLSGLVQEIGKTLAKIDALLKAPASQANYAEVAKGLKLVGEATQNSHAYLKVARLEFKP